MKSPYNIIYFKSGEPLDVFAREHKDIERLSDAKESGRQSLITLTRDFNAKFVAYIMQNDKHGFPKKKYLGHVNMGNNKAAWHKVG